ncbi:Membrane carboxypeptidase (penicillin-binding protein) [Geodermatophilus dictyosporus]|uniref:Membrane carboxypeptidase (Penicillin-binding protein) n=1 Tax=Geodermatophilus dictyosporus TaxID=1523247 RepID=A0A1I5N388_9ACTN|nr:transglycosylase domain-containing protein [Geodermatophilus dictyosporus]SFP16177.1 Membrane carboxypeptidase (penicillin-binding protein) [Geodermatophilus dictyosporus]
MSTPARARVLAKLALMIVIAGALVAGVLAPAIAGGGIAARNSASLLDALPVELTDATPAGNSRVLAADGSLITNFYANNRTVATADQIADVVKQALVDIEDARFYQHNGLDVQGTLRAAVTNVAAGSVQEGGSTLTQQLVKQTLLETADTPEERQAATEQDISRKLREARLALALEETYSKDEILTRYLNIVYFGQGAYGIQAAAQKYFSVNAADLTLPQAAMLAGLVQSPANDDPITNPENAQTRRNQVLQRMFDLGHISEAELTEISAQPVQVAPGINPPNGCIDAAIGGFFCAYLQGYLTGVLGITQEQLDNGGLTIQTTLDPQLQALGDQAVLNTLPMGDQLAGMFTAVRPGTGDVLAMSVNRQFGCSDPQCESVVLHAAASKGAGSTYKVFTAAAALEAGIPASTVISTPGNQYTSRVFRGPSCGGDREQGNGMYCVQNVGNYPDTLDMVGALVRSSNTYFLALEDRLGSVEGPVRMAERMGMNFDQPTQNSADEIIDGNFGSFTLGAEATSPLDLVTAYATLGAQGTQCDPVPVVQVLDRAGQPLTREDGQPVVTDGGNCTPNAIPPNVANTLANILVGDTASPEGTGTRAAIPGHAIAGKTGTSQGRDSVAFVGVMPEYAASVMVFNPKQQQDVGGYGGNMPATIWRNAFAPYLADKPTSAFAPSDPALLGPAPAPAPAPQAGGGGNGGGDDDGGDDGGGRGNWGGGNGGGRGN